MASFTLYFVGRDQKHALERGPITMLDTAGLIARSDPGLKVFYTYITIKSWMLTQPDADRDDTDLTPFDFYAALKDGEPVVILPYRPDRDPGVHNTVYFDLKLECWQLSAAPAHRRLNDDGWWPSGPADLS